LVVVLSATYLTLTQGAFHPSATIGFSVHGFVLTPIGQTSRPLKIAARIFGRILRPGLEVVLQTRSTHSMAPDKAAIERKPRTETTEVLRKANRMATAQMTTFASEGRLNDARHRLGLVLPPAIKALEGQASEDKIEKAKTAIDAWLKVTLPHRAGRTQGQSPNSPSTAIWSDGRMLQ
jgi:hypothetical protein